MKKLVFLVGNNGHVPDIFRLHTTLRDMTRQGAVAPLSPSFPAVTCSVQTNMTTGVKPAKHGIISNGLYLHEKMPVQSPPPPRIVPPSVSASELSDPCNVSPTWPRAEKLPMVELWTMPNAAIDTSQNVRQIWDQLREKTRKNGDGQPLRSAVWFALMSKFCSADYVCNFAPIHNPDGSESLWCYTRPYMLYGNLRDTFGHFPVKHYWGPLAGLPASKWITDTAIFGARQFLPDFQYIYIPRLDYTPQKFGPSAPQLTNDLAELDALLADMRKKLSEIDGEEPAWLVAGEYAMTEVNSVVYPNRVLRDLGLLSCEIRDGLESLDLTNSRAFALCDHQMAHVYFNENDPQLIEKVARAFRAVTEIDEVLVGQEDLARLGIDHPRSGQIVLATKPDSWFSYYFWNDDAKAPAYARTVDIHRKPGYDPVEMFFDMKTMSVPLDATLIKGSHGAPVRNSAQKTVILSSEAALLAEKPEFDDVDVFSMIDSFFSR